jgi:CBS domain-containing protein
VELIDPIRPIRKQLGGICAVKQAGSVKNKAGTSSFDLPRRERIARLSVSDGEFNRGGQAMKIGKVMSREVQLIKPDDTIRSAAALMKKIDAGLLPVTENDKLVGMITDRDIAIRGVAEGKGPDAKVRDAMSPEVKYCFEDEDVAHVAENMAELQVRRLPVMNRDKRLVGIVSLADLAIEGSLPKTAKALHGISQPGGQHNQRGPSA